MSMNTTMPMVAKKSMQPPMVGMTATKIPWLSTIGRFSEPGITCVGGGFGDVLLAHTLLWDNGEN